MARRMTFNEFQRLLHRFEITGNQAYVLTALYEAFADVTKQVEEMAKLQVEFANQLQGFVQLSEATNKKMVALATGRYRVEDASVESVALSPEEFDRNKKKN